MLAWLPFLQYGVLESWVSHTPPSLPPHALVPTSLLQFLLPVEKLHLANGLRVPGTLRGVQDLPCFWPGSVSRSCFLLPRLHASFQRVVMKAGRCEGSKRGRGHGNASCKCRLF